MNKNGTTIFAIIAIAFLIYPLSVWGQTFSLSLDADTDLGDQKVLSVKVPADQIVPIQINGHGLQGATGISFRLEFDSQQVVFDDDSAGYTTYYGGSISYTYSPTFIEIEMEPHDPIAVDSAMVVIVGFRTKANFSHTTIRLVWAEKWIEEHKERVPINVGIELLLGQARPAPPSSDFNDDGRVDFPDFLLFVGKFGSKQGDETYQDRFDLDSDDAIGFSDFLIFSSAFGQSARHEIGHVLGIGTHWRWHNFIENNARDNPGADTHFTGPLAIKAFDQAGGANYKGAKVPVENQGFSDTDTHWRENVFGDELMSTSGSNVSLSAITIQALADLGYIVDVSKADPYRLPPPTSKPAIGRPKFFCVPIIPDRKFK